MCVCVCVGGGGVREVAQSDLCHINYTYDITHRHLFKSTQQTGIFSFRCALYKIIKVHVVKQMPIAA